jgi:hypothetical protein
MLTTRILIVCSLFFFIATGALAADLTAQQIVDRANQASYYAGKDGRANVQMTITDKNGGTRNREFTILRLNGENGDQKFYVYFRAPADVHKMVFLVWKHLQDDDNRWLWLPALNLKKAIAPGDKRTSFVGSDFLYEDVSGRGINEDHHELIAEKEGTYLIKSVPKDPSNVEFAWFQTLIDAKTFLPIKAEYFDRNNKRYRVVESIETKTIDGFPTVMIAEARDLISGSVTRNQFSDVEYNIGLKDQIFTERFLRRPPREIGR